MARDPAIPIGIGGYGDAGRRARSSLHPGRLIARQSRELRSVDYRVSVTAPPFRRWMSAHTTWIVRSRPAGGQVGGPTGMPGRADGTLCCPVLGHQQMDAAAARVKVLSAQLRTDSRPAR